MTQELLTKCSRCESEIVFSAGINIINCPYCGRPNSRPKSQSNETNLMKYANERRNMGEFKEAEIAYRQVLQACAEEHEARWGLLLCKYGVMYVESESGKERLITCRRGRQSAFRSEPDYQTVLSEAPDEVRKAYEQDGEYIDRIQAEIRRLRRTLEPYQVFICYKETGPSGERTEDSVLAQGIYNALTRRKYRVFYAPVSLKNLAGANYEAAIFCAIESSPIMLVVGTKKEYLESTWVRSEWSRFLELCDKDEATDRLLIPLYRDLNPGRDLPREFRDRYLESLDMRNPGYMFDIEDIISKVIKAPNASEPEKQDNRLTLVKLYLQVGNFQEAGTRLDPLLIEQPRNPEVWLYKAMLDEQIRREEDFISLPHSLRNNSHFQMALSLAQGERRVILEQYQQAVKERLIKEAEARKAEEARKAVEAARKAEEARQKAEEKRRKEEQHSAVHARTDEQNRKAKETQKAQKPQKKKWKRRLFKWSLILLLLASTAGVIYGYSRETGDETFANAISTVQSFINELTAEALFIPGTYEATAEGFGGEVKATVTVDKHTIKAIEIIGEDETPAIGGKAISAMAEAYVGKNAADAVDSIAGATFTSKGVKEAVGKVIAAAKK